MSQSGIRNTVAEETQSIEADQRLFLIFEIARILATEPDPDTMAPRLLSCLVEKLEPADVGMLLLYDPRDGHLTVKAARGCDVADLAQIRVSPGEALSGEVFQTGQPELYPTAEIITAALSGMTPANYAIFMAATSQMKQPQSAVLIPLVTDHTKVGVLILGNLRRPYSFTDVDLGFLQHVADLITVAIENARLRDELQAVRALDEANRLKGELMSTLAHEMRTPLTSIKGYSTAMLMEEAAFSLETQREFLQFIDEECDVLQDLIHDLLESSVIDAGFLKLELQPVMLPRLVESLTDNMAHHHPHYRFLVNFPNHFPIVDADRDRVAQVLRNLLDNAIKYSPQGGMIVVRGEVREDEVVISIADQGIGIAPEHLNRLFEKFYRVRSGLGPHVVGSGLGLPIARAIVESHGGRIWAESQVGQGTTLYFTLPLHGSSQELPA